MVGGGQLGGEVVVGRGVGAVDGEQVAEAGDFARYALRQTSHLFGQVAGEVETDEAAVFDPERGRVA